MLYVVEGGQQQGVEKRGLVLVVVKQALGWLGQERREER